jgi:exonuclease SbcC
MIKDLEMKEFISHKDTHLEFGRGITIFVGHNGAGKSSVIDAVTFSLFGEHTRRSNKNLVRRGGSGQAMVRMLFTLNSKEFSATRSLTATGTASFSQLELVSEGGKKVNKKLAGGERRQYGESMSAEVAKLLGLDYKKLQVAAVVQQGELAKIVDAQPKEFKELLNGLIGIDRLDSAFTTMKDVVAGFRARLRDEVEGGYSDEDLPKVRLQVAENEKKLAEAQRLAREYANEKVLLDEKLHQLEKEIESLEPLRQKKDEVSVREKRLLRYVEEKRGQVALEISRLERVVKEARAALGLMKNKDEVCMRLQMVKDEIEEIQRQMETNDLQMGKLRGFLECASKIKIVDGKCPVCNSAVTKINEMFDGNHIQQDIRRIDAEKSRLQKERMNLKKEDLYLTDEGKKIAAAEAFLASNSIKSMDDVAKIEMDLGPRKEAITRLPNTIAADGVAEGDPFALVIDETSLSFAEEIAQLKEQVKRFSMARYTSAKDERWKTVQKLQETSTKLGAYQKAVQDIESAIKSNKSAIKKLEVAEEIVCLLERIRSLVFNRDGAVGMSLRSWALGMISKKASDYATLFNIGISRIELAEKARDISITCYGKNGEIDMDSLSGGEKVAIALALRLGIAHIMGSNKLDFVILDEPTTHLDEERRKALVKIISEAFREGAGPLSQMLIITHDSEIFEDSEVDAVYRFSMTADGSKITKE